jgi:hypothetical protein
MSDFIGFTETSHGLALVEFGADLVLFVTVIFFEVSLDERGIHRARRNAVHPDLCRIVDGQLPGHRNDGSLGPAVGESLFNSDQSGDRTDIDDAAV